MTQGIYPYKVTLRLSATTLFLLILLGAMQATTGVTDVHANTDNATAKRLSEMPVLLVQNDWTSQSVLAQIVRNLLDASGIPVELVPFDSQLQFRALADGRVHFQIAVWEGPMHEAFEDARGRGMVDAGSHSATSREGWWIPDYVLDDCPDAINWIGLNDCAPLFSTDESNSTGRFLGPPQDWGKDYAQRVEALQMNFRVFNVDAIGELWSQLYTAYEKREPIVLFNWTPNFTDVQYAGSFVDFPEPVDECETDASWGSNPDATGDCGDPHSHWLKKAAWNGLAQMNPAAWKILQRVNFTNAHIARAIYLVDVEDLSIEDAATAWSHEYSQVIDQWRGG